MGERVVNPSDPPTKELWVPVTGISTGGGQTILGDSPVQLVNAVGPYAVVAFAVPTDFNNILVAELIVIPGATQAAAEWTYFSDYGEVGQNYAVHSELENALTFNVVLHQLFAIDVSSILSALTNLDHVGIGIQIRNVAHIVYLRGFRLRYA